MEDQQEEHRSRVIKINSFDSWDYYSSEATSIIVHFTASWCVPSLAMHRFFQQMAEVYQDALFLTVDVDEVKEVAVKSEVKALPTFVLMKDGLFVDKIVGANPEELRKRIDGFVDTRRQLTP